MGLVVMVLGIGLLKPNVSSVVGALYEGQAGARRDAGFSIFYMGINLGAAAGPFIAGGLGEGWNWRLGFLTCGVAMLIGLAQFKLTQRFLGTAGYAPPVSPQQRKRTWTLVAAIGVAVLIGASLLFMGENVPSETSSRTVSSSRRSRSRSASSATCCSSAASPPSRRNASASSSCSSSARRCSGAASSSRPPRSTPSRSITPIAPARQLVPGKRASRVVVPVDQSDLHHRVRAVLRVVLGRARRAQSRSFGAVQDGHRSRVAGRRLPRHDVRRAARGFQRRQGRPHLAVAGLPDPHLRRVVPVAGRALERHQARAGEIREPHDGHVVPRHRDRQHHRGPGRRTLRFAQGRRTPAPISHHDVDRRRRRRIHHVVRPSLRSWIGDRK